MNQKLETARQTLVAMGFEDQKVDAAIASLSGQRSNEHSEYINEPLLTPNQLRERLQISSTSLWRLQDLPYIKVGGCKRFLWSEIIKYLEKPTHEKRRLA